jgi:hypothetical protein
MADAKVLSNQKTILANQATIMKIRRRSSPTVNHREEPKDASGQPGRNQKTSLPSMKS